MEIKEIKNLKDYPKPLFMEDLGIISDQMKNCLGRIIIDNIYKGTGFFCEILLNNSQDLLTFFITNNSIINEDFLKNKKNEIKVQLNNGQINKIIKLDDKLYYTNKEQDVTIIEFKKEIDNIDKFLYLDEYILHDKEYAGNTIYLLHYIKNKSEQKTGVSVGLLKNRFSDKKYSFKHFCNTGYETPGSPILNLSNHGVIGISKQNENNNPNYNIGIYLHESILAYVQKYKDKKIEKISFQLNLNKFDANNEITLKYKNDNGNDIKLFGIPFVKENKDKCLISYDGKYKELCSYLHDIPKNNNGLFEIKLKGVKNITNIVGIFRGCTQLVSAPDITKIDISKSNCNEVFLGCISLKTLPDISKWKDKLLNGKYNFFCCSSLEDLINFKAEDIERFYEFNFFRCKKLINNLKNK